MKFTFEENKLTSKKSSISMYQLDTLGGSFEDVEKIKDNY